MRLLPLLLPSLALAHGTHSSDDPDPSLPWALRHLISEHHITNYDAGAFFTLHDFDNSHTLSRDEILRLYGSPTQNQDHIWHTLRSQIDANNDGELSYHEWMEWSRRGGELPDFGTGLGHHGDDETEYEIHHFEKFHKDDREDGSDMVMHQEDLDHFKLHEEEEKKAALAAAVEASAVNLGNVPVKFLVQGK
ncbi:hypothetical protein K440DRAFT_538828 [Wilcoxina mikolae CBS 423.85]|nr:hypothetical protein K440DRAFT_538828 [Wilcoxina mikolae CBS 423.85]